ncbi:BRD4-interacting chromatin-remodeling complex-associated protein-like isoform X1 [Astyanax mexicanus]|uniref:BRD4-interacting chromatin-remodeling complex-associated protein-like isoform X1 n=1 Tax=Astyanax mexicanus TaxID=7994 RepID=A0A8T2L8D3_ASTMX|nr:BRD4-interacting chromatin-remodeling complex-associated protein-like isoform X1 [Astyanax mexicanus]
MLPSAGAALLRRPVQRWRGNPVDKALLFHDGVMDDEDDRHLLDFIGNVPDLNDCLHGSSNKSLDEDDLANTTYGSAGSFFANDTGGSDDGLKDGHGHLEEFGESGGAGLQLSSSLQFIEDELEGDVSPSDLDLGGEDQPFDILQKSLLEADITEQTLAQEALLDSQPTMAPVTTTYPQQLVSGGFGGVTGAGVMAPLPLAGAQPQAFIQQVPQLPLANGPAGHIQLVGSFNGGAPSMMTINSLERPQILLRPGTNAMTNSTGQGAAFGPSAPGQVSVPFNKGAIPLQNIIIQRGPAPQTFVRPIQPKPLQTGGQAVYNITNIGIQPNSTTATANPANIAYTANGSPQTSQQLKVVSQGTSIVVHSPLGQQGQPQTQGQFLLPSSLALSTGNTVPGFQAVNGQVLQTNTQVGDPSLTSTTTYSILTNQNAAVQIIPGQNFAAGGQLLVNQGMVNASQIGQASPTAVVQVSQRPGVAAKVWTAKASPSPAALQTSQGPSRLTMVNPGAQAFQAHQQLSVNTGPRLLVPVAQNTTNSINVAGQELQCEKQQVPLNQDSTLSTRAGQTQLVNLLGTKGVKMLTPANQDSVLTSTPKRPATQQLTRGGMILQQLRRDHTGVMSPDRAPFTSLNDVIERLLPYHVFQGAPPCEEDFTKVDEEFQAAATQVLKRTQAMVNKYRRLLMVEAERFSPSSEIVMIDRTFNQEERNTLTQDKRTVLVDPDGFLEDFCCGPKKKTLSSGATDSLPNEDFPSLMGTSPCQDMTSNEDSDEEGRSIHMEPAYRTEPYSAFEDPGGGKQMEHGGTSIKITIDLKKKRSNNFLCSSSESHQHLHHAPYSTSPSPSHSDQLYPPEQPMSSDHGHVSLADTDSVLEAAVNSILEC